MANNTNTSTPMTPEELVFEYLNDLSEYKAIPDSLAYMGTETVQRLNQVAVRVNGLRTRINEIRTQHDMLDDIVDMLERHRMFDRIPYIPEAK